MKFFKRINYLYHKSQHRCPFAKNCCGICTVMALELKKFKKVGDWLNLDAMEEEGKTKDGRH